MNCSCFLILLCAVFVNSRKINFIYAKDIISFKYPSPLKVTMYYKPKAYIDITWDAVKDWDKDDPIIGYKVALWEMKNMKHLVKTFVNGEIKVEEVFGTPNPGVPVGDPRIFVVSANNRNITVENIKKNTWYEHTGFAFTQKTEGPLTPIAGFNLGPDDFS